MKYDQKIVNNLINENIFPLKVSSFKARRVIFDDKQFTTTHISQNKSFNLAQLIWLATLTHILNGYDIS